MSYPSLTEVHAFATEMHRIMVNNGHKGGWDNISHKDLLLYIQREFIELCQSMFDDYQNPADIRQALVDIANFCFFGYYKMKNL